MFRDETTITPLEDLAKEQARYPALSFMSGPSMGQIHLLQEGEYVVGRSRSVSISVQDDAISRQHFKLQVKGGEVLLEDSKSTNGTFVNGVRVDKKVLEDKDTIQISSQTVATFSYVSDLEAQKRNQIYKMANFDPVTQARTKYYFLDQIEQEFSHSKRKGMPLSLIIFDIDFFKKINDTYGHPAGDYVLKRIAQITQELIRTEDLFARYGGEEFVVLMRETSEFDAVSLAERICTAIAQSDFQFDANRFKVNISAGVACLQSDNFSSAAEMIKTADQYLYFSKANGRNRVSSQASLLNSKK
ncbi:MAG: diguanylate cyclase [Deltaproteobacteria bacterium]|nr:diguanylate cyclase [Deltaproteobacteria bacterium]